MNRSRSLWYTSKAESFTQALPIGNGSFGGMVYANFPEGKISLNMDTLWSGTGTKPEIIPENGALEEARRMIFAGDYYAAEQLVENKLLGFNNESYMPMATLHYELEGIPGEDFIRELDLENGICRGEIGKEKKLTVEFFASFPDDTIACRFEYEDGQRFSGIFSIDSILCYELQANERSYLQLQGVAPSHVEPNYVDSKDPVIYDTTDPGLRFLVRICATDTDGEVSYGDVVHVDNASYITLVLIAVNSYCGYQESHDVSYEAMGFYLDQKMRKLSAKEYAQIRADHIEDYRKLYKRVILTFGEEDQVQNLPTDKRLARLREGAEDPDLYALFFQYNRYLLIASSRPGSQAGNLQGIWNEELRPAWSSNYTININTEMNYWAACGVNLAECQQPLHDLIRDMSINGQKTAKNQYGCNGWAANHNVDLWRQTNPVAGLPKWAYWPMGGVWMSASLFEYYQFTQDRRFLKDTAYPILEGCVRFCLDWLCEGADGRLHTCPSTSPENVFYDTNHNICSVSYSCTLDIALLKELFAVYEKMDSLIGVDQQLLDEIRLVKERLADYQIGPDGCIQEWIMPFEEVELGHRHLTPVYGLHPGNTINEYDCPDIVNACEKFLDKRLKNGGGHTGWSCAWLISMFARIRNCEKAEYYLQHLMKESVYSNLFDLHPPLGQFEGEKEVFQIDGNFGANEGMLNMLVQSHLEEVYLLPALPAMWKCGEVKGLCARGGFTVDLKWQEKALKEAVIYSKAGEDLKIRADVEFSVLDEGGNHLAVSKNGILSMSTQAGNKYYVVT